MDRLEYIWETLEKGLPISEEEARFAHDCHKLFAEADHSDAEVERLKALTSEQSNSLDDLLDELEKEVQASDN